MLILGLTGHKKSGKDTAVIFLKEFLPKLRIKRVGFADALKEDICKLVECDLEYLEKHKDNFRLLMQGYGTDIRRQLFGEYYWINRLDVKLGELFRAGQTDLIIINDVRFKNEAEYIHNVGGKLWRIQRKTDEAKDFHPSELELESLEPFCIVDNSTSLAAFQHEVQLAWMRTFESTKTHK